MPKFYKNVLKQQISKHAWHSRLVKITRRRYNKRAKIELNSGAFQTECILYFQPVNTIITQHNRNNMTTINTTKMKRHRNNRVVKQQVSFDPTS